ncbi:hypothetical protein PC112_g11159 [Phytophthora cactorum]|uniref:Uncharacterized protein n=1 Tax=Phytophthora cactorum TaxID=29920 RepID=A0A8T1D4J7_9STRA|nr:hypothetical protein PC112_g11159 [Phytophthora cactorum]KAG2936897.1 hypothetical protein PC117_g11939 [Phytophthora cactorum]KAG3174975.1 hypothetical protein C6341_g9665 [Phytophthora cactorum]
MLTVASKALSVYLDSKARELLGSTDSITDFEFRVSPRHTHLKDTDGNVVVSEIPTVVTYFKIPRIMLPYNTELRKRNCTNEITLTFTGLRSNGILAHEDTYHSVFSYDSTKNQGASMDELIPVNKYCKFSRHRLRPVSFNYNSTEGRIAFDAPHGLSSGDVIVVDGLATQNNAGNSDILCRINDPRGIIINEIDTYIIATNINFSRLKTPESTSLPWIIVTSRPFRFP